jgi:anti-sigma B factor antagonist
MTIDVEDRSGVKVLRPKGKLTGEDGKTLVDTASRFLGGEGPGLVLHMADVSYMNSAGLGELVRLSAKANMQKQKVVFAAPSEFVNRVFQATKLDTFFEVCPDLDQAAKALER